MCDAWHRPATRSGRVEEVAGNCSGCGAARRLASTRRLEERPSLALFIFRACTQTAVWLRRWVYDMPVTLAAPSALIVSLLGGC